ncbi:MAG: glycerophosphodiester phosphodiesterase [Pseudomonadota bacterium]
MPRLIGILIALAMSLAGFPAVAADKTIIAHRGASGYLPEHTLEAKAMAHAMGAQFIEQDLVLTRDDVPIVLHDKLLDTVTNVAALFPDRARDDGRFYAIDFTLEEIRQLAVNERIDLTTGKPVFPSRFPTSFSSFKVPTLEEELELIAGLNRSTGRKAGIYPEIKAPAFHRSEGKDISRIVLNILAKHGYSTIEDPIFLQCFDFNETKRIRNELGYKGRLVQLIAENAWQESPDVDFDYLRTEAGLREVAEVADGIGPWLNHILDQDLKPTGLVEVAQSAGLAVHPYTLRADALPHTASDHNTVLEAILFGAGADGIFTDFPDLAVNYLKVRVEER